MERGTQRARAPPFACSLECRIYARGRNRFVKYEDFNQTDDRRKANRPGRNRSDARNEKLMIARSYEPRGLSTLSRMRSPSLRAINLIRAAFVSTAALGDRIDVKWGCGCFLTRRGGSELFCEICMSVLLFRGKCRFGDEGKPLGRRWIFCVSNFQGDDSRPVISFSRGTTRR